MGKVFKFGCGGLIALAVVLGIIGALVGGNKPTASPTVASVAANPGNTPVPPSPTPTMAKVGDPVEAANWGYMVKQVEKAKTLKWSNFGNSSQAKGQWVVLQIGIVNTGKETYPLNEWDMEIHDAAGLKYKADSLTSSMYGQYLGGSSAFTSYPPNSPVLAVAVFDVSPTATGLKLWLVQAKKYIALE